MNLGGSLSVCAGIHKNRVVLWKYLDPKWNGAAAANSTYDVENDVKRRHDKLRQQGRYLDESALICGDGVRQGCNYL